MRYTFCRFFLARIATPFACCWLATVPFLLRAQAFPPGVGISDEIVTDESFWHETSGSLSLDEVVHITDVLQQMEIRLMDAHNRILRYRDETTASGRAIGLEVLYMDVTDCLAQGMEIASMIQPYSETSSRARPQSPTYVLTCRRAALLVVDSLEEKEALLRQALAHPVLKERPKLGSLCQSDLSTVLARQGRLREALDAFLQAIGHAISFREDEIGDGSPKLEDWDHQELSISLFALADARQELVRAGIQTDEIRSALRQMSRTQPLNQRSGWSDLNQRMEAIPSGFIMDDYMRIEADSTGLTTTGYIHPDAIDFRRILVEMNKTPRKTSFPPLRRSRGGASSLD